MSRALRATALTLALASLTRVCVGFLPAPLAIAPRASTAKASLKGGAISFRDAPGVDQRARRGCCSPLMMAKSTKQGKGKGKGKSGRMDLIESMAAAEKGEAPLDTSVGEEEEEEEMPAPAFSVDKLKAETKTPFRTLRFFLYGGFGLAALIGAVTALSQLAATVAEKPGALELNQVLINLLVDFGVMALAGFCYNVETSQLEGMEQAETAARTRQERLQATKITGDVNAERVKQLRGLRVKIPGTGDGEELEGAKEAPVGVLMDEAKQGFCVLAGGKEFIRDSMLAAMLAKNQIFPTLNLLVVPVDMGGEVAKGFAKPFSYEEEGYVAAPVDEAEWRSVMGEELAAAERQGGTKPSSSNDGIVLVVDRRGKVLRRGLGVPVWKTIRDDVDPPVKKKKT